MWISAGRAAHASRRTEAAWEIIESPPERRGQFEVVEMQRGRTRPSPQVVAEDGDAATRYLCAGAHLDLEFAHRVVEDLFEQQHRAAAPSYGIDLKPILQHCFAARRRRLKRDVAVLLALLWNFLFNLPGLFALWLVVGAGYSLFKRLGSSTAARALAWGILTGIPLAIASVIVLATSIPALPWIRGNGSLDLASILAVLALALVVVVGNLVLQGLRSESAAGRAFARGVTAAGLAVGLAVTLWATRLNTAFSNAANSLSQFGPLRGRAVGLVLGLALLLSIVQALMVWLPVMISDNAARRLIVTKLQVGSFSRDTPAASVPPWLEKRYKHLTTSQAGNLTVYSGFRPFVGAGENIGGWSVFVDLSEGRKGAEPMEFATHELLEFVTKRLNERLVNIDERFKSSVTMPIEIDGRAIVHWKSMRGADLFSGPRTGPPVERVSSDFIEDLIQKPSTERRHCLRIQTRLWGNEVVVTTFLYLDVRGSTLYVEAVRCILYPVKSDYHRADFLPNSSSALEWLQIFRATLRAVPDVISAAPMSILRTLTLARRSAKWRKIVGLAVRDRRPIDHGASTSVRELGADTRFHHYFQSLDAVEALKLSQHHLLDAILSFLDSKKINTEQFWSRRETIINMGIMLGEGSTLKNEGNFAVGPNASAIGGGQSDAGSNADNDSEEDP